MTNHFFFQQILFVKSDILVLLDNDNVKTTAQISGQDSESVDDIKYFINGYVTKVMSTKIVAPSVPPAPSALASSVLASLPSAPASSASAPSVPASSVLAPSVFGQPPSPQSIIVQTAVNSVIQTIGQQYEDDINKTVIKKAATIAANKIVTKANIKTTKTTATVAAATSPDESLYRSSSCSKASGY